MPLVKKNITLAAGATSDQILQGTTYEYVDPGTRLVVAAAESTQVESASKIVIDSPPKRFPEFDASSNAILAPSLIAGVKDSIGPVKPRIIPTLISANAAVVTVDKLTITARSNFFIFPPKKYTFYIGYLIY